MPHHLEYPYFQNKPPEVRGLALLSHKLAFHHLHSVSPSAGYFTSYMSSKNTKDKRSLQFASSVANKN